MRGQPLGVGFMGVAPLMFSCAEIFNKISNYRQAMNRRRDSYLGHRHATALFPRRRPRCGSERAGGMLALPGRLPSFCHAGARDSIWVAQSKEFP